MVRPSLFALLALLMLLAGPARGQIPDEFSNLQLLDPAIERSELASIMRDWAFGLGVRCHHCHVGPEDLRGMDFASHSAILSRRQREAKVLGALETEQTLKSTSESSPPARCATAKKPRPPRFSPASSSP